MTHPQRKPYIPDGYTPPHKTTSGNLRTCAGVVIGGAYEAKPAHSGEPACNEPHFDDDNGSPVALMLAAVTGLCGVVLVLGAAAALLGLIGGTAKAFVEGIAFHLANNLTFGAGFDELLRQLRDEPILGFICGGLLLAIVIVLFAGQAVDILSTEERGHNDRDD